MDSAKQVNNSQKLSEGFTEELSRVVKDAEKFAR
jgi:hypothetical protein